MPSAPRRDLKGLAPESRLRPVLWLLLVASILLAPIARATAPASLLAQANQAYRAGRYADAARDYQAVIDAGRASADLFFNLGTSALKAGERGRAILAFERALKVDPDDADAAYNLALAQKGNIDKVVGSREEEPLVERIGRLVPPRAIGLWFLAGWLFGMAVLVVRRFSRTGRGALALAGALSLAVAAASGLLALAAAWHEHYSTYAVVVTPSTEVREGPAADFRSAFELHEGLKVRVVRREKSFLRIRLPNGSEGWVSEHDAPVI